MRFVLGRDDDGEACDSDDADTGPTGWIGRYRAMDGSGGAPLHLDLDGPHASLVLGKRGYGKSYTLGVIAEELARGHGVAPVLVDPMGAFTPIADGSSGVPVPTEVVAEPTVTPNALDPRSWCDLLDLSPEGGAGGLVWQAAQREDSVQGMRAHVAAADADEVDKRAATNHLDIAAAWGVFDVDGLDATALGTGALTVLDVSGLDPAPMNAVCRGVGEALYRARVTEAIPRLPWLLVDEAHAFFDGVAAAALETILTRGRAPGVSLVMATQRPSVVPEVAISQSDVLISHRLTARSDLDALRTAQPTYMQGGLEDRMPTDTGAVLIIDDATETVHTATIRTRDTPHGGDDSKASTVSIPRAPGAVDGDGSGSAGVDQ